MRSISSYHATINSLEGRRIGHTYTPHKENQFLETRCIPADMPGLEKKKLFLVTSSSNS